MGIPINGDDPLSRPLTKERFFCGRKNMNQAEVEQWWHDVTSEATPNGLLRSVRVRQEFRFPGEIGGKSAEVAVVPLDLRPNGLAQTLRFELERAGVPAEKRTIAFSDPVRVGQEGISLARKGKTVKGRSCVLQQPVDPCLPFRGDKKSVRRLEILRAKSSK